jgi:hypothetical protein
MNVCLQFILIDLFTPILYWANFFKEQVLLKALLDLLFQPTSSEHESVSEVTEYQTQKVVFVERMIGFVLIEDGLHLLKIG